MLLQLAHPETAARTCDACLRWVFNSETGYLVRNKITDEPILRPPGTKTPCLTCPKCAHTIEKTPQSGRECDLSKRNRLTLARYYEQQIAPSYQDDVTKRNFGIIQEVLALHDRSVQRAQLQVLKVFKI